MGGPLAGLTTREARRRLADAGPNDPAPAPRSELARWFVVVLSNPLVIVLLAAGGIAAALGQRTDASIIVVVVGLSTVLNLVQTTRSHRAAERLRARVAPTATVRRDGAWTEIPRRGVVPGDVVRLAAGDRVPADARLVETRDLHVQQAALTGESMPVEKAAGDGDGDHHTVFLGTSVVSGTATAVVTATGGATAFGDIAARLSTRPPETEFERGTRQFAFLIMRTVVLLVLFVVLAGVILHHPPLETLLFAIALAVGLTPEFLPMITAVTLANGAVHMARRKVVVRHLEAIENFGSMDVLCTDKTGTLTSGEMAVQHRVNPFGRASPRPFELAYVNSAHETGIKSPLDAAILAAGAPDIARYVKIDEIPFDFERRRLSVVVAAQDARLLVTKGAPESVLPLCTTYEADGVVRVLDDAARRRIDATHGRLSAEGARVLAVAYAPVPPAPAYGHDAERDLIVVGFVAFFDPPMRGVRDALRKLREGGVAVKVLTGDNELVARRVCADVGLDVTRVVDGPEIDRMSDGALGAVAETVTLFVRVSPAQKTRILLALKHREHVVGFLGDGINDAPSLHAADVGISVANAVDVARDAADIILLERNLDVLHAGILEGRRAFGNVMKYVLMGTSSNFGNMFSMAVAFLFLPFLPMLPTQILLNNFLYDLAQVTIPTDHVDEAYVAAPQRWDIGVIRDFMLTLGPVSSVFDFLTFGALLWVFQAPAALFQTGWFVESLATQTLVLFVVRTAGSPFRSRPSLPLTVTTIGIVLVGVALPFSPFASAMGFVPLPVGYLAFLGAVTMSYLAISDIVKERLFRRRLRRPLPRDSARG
jgi:Mg2+-importing ATPase